MNEPMLTEQVPDKTVAESLDETESELVSEVLNETSDEIPEEVLDEALGDTSEETPNETLDEGAEQPQIISDEKQGPSDETETLRARIHELEQELAAREQMSRRMERECTEFETYFPDVSLKGVPDEVWGQVHAGVPLSAAYALYEKKQQKQQADAARIGQRGESLTAGMVDTAGNEYFSPSQVRAMSPSEVRQNYDRIFESMRHWQ